MTAIAPAGRTDTLVIGLVGLAHLLSHLYQMALGPIFKLLQSDFQVSYTELGLVLTVFYAVSGCCQAFVGILVDRYGADRFMIGGVITMASAIFLMGLVPSYLFLFPLAVIAALGNSVFHPADLSILSGKVSQDRHGRAFAVHAFGGSCGYFLAPVIIFYGVAEHAGWRAGLFVAGGLGLAAAALMLRHRGALRMPVQPAAAPDPGGRRETATAGIGFYFRLLTNLPLLAAFAYFTLVAAAGVGVQVFTSPALVEIYGTPLYITTAGFTIFLLSSAVGTLLGGELADRMHAHGAIAATGMALGGIVMAALTFLSLPIGVIIVLLGVAGVSVGVSNPSRDILIRNAAPRGASGRVFGFVYSGLDLGSAMAPLLFGYLLDGGEYRGVFGAIAAMYFVAVFTILQLKRGSKPVPALAE